MYLTLCFKLIWSIYLTVAIGWLLLMWYEAILTWYDEIVHVIKPCDTRPCDTNVHVTQYFQHTSLHRSQEPHILQTSTKTQQKTSPMDAGLHWLWPQTHTHPGSKLCTPNALSRQPNLIPKIDNDNKGVTLLPPSLFVNLIDTDLNKKITKSSEKDLLVLNTLQALEGEVPTQFRSCLSDWSYNVGILTYQGRVFLPDWDNIRQDIVKLHHDHPTTRHPGYLKTCQLISAG